MNETMSLFLATTILALGGLGLYMYKSNDDNQTGGADEEYNEEGMFNSGGLFNWKSETDEKETDRDENNIDEEEFKPRKRVAKTQRNKRGSYSAVL